MLVVCPPGLGAGDLVLVDFEGAEVEVIVPDGVAAGDEFEVAGMAFEEEGESPADIRRRQQQQQPAEDGGGSNSAEEGQDVALLATVRQQCSEGVHEEAAEADDDSSASSTLRISATAPAPSHLVDSQPWDDSRRLRRKEAWALMELEAQRAAQLEIDSNHVNRRVVREKVQIISVIC